jgi:hypothetical protein
MAFPLRREKSPRLRATLSEENMEQRFRFDTSCDAAHSAFRRTKRQTRHEMLLHREEHRH